MEIDFAEFQTQMSQLGAAFAMAYALRPVLTPILFPPSIWIEVLVFKGMREFSGRDTSVIFNSNRGVSK
jgi:hypothetical protein